MEEVDWRIVAISLNRKVSDLRELIDLADRHGEKEMAQSLRIQGAILDALSEALFAGLTTPESN